MPSIYFPALDKLESGSLATLAGDEFHHLSHVAHRRAKDPVLLNSGRGIMARGVVRAMGRSSATLEIIEKIVQPGFGHPFAIAFGLLKNRHDELIVEKCTELGASAFFPLISEHSVRQASANTIQRMEKIALAAIKQCDNPWLPEVFPPQEVEVALKKILEQGYTPIVCSERRPELWLHHLSAGQAGRPCFLIGPEGGWSEEEYSLFAGLAEIALASLVTRAETAAISIAAQWLAYANQLSTTGTTK